ncbi:MAG: N-acetylmuramoyl-L-alanine amidase [Lachnospiraceae bacterium]|nr:N-acetylmuramoyl-L-alanine amidase [Lachnospiraceae bacterium]
MFRKKFIISLLTLAAFFLFCLPVQAGGIPAGKDRIIICIDPGHGGAAAGFECTYDGAVVREKDLNLSIALKLRDELLEYENVDVIMTREDDTGIKIRPRVQSALDNQADYLISIHNNNTANVELASGCMVLSTVSHYQAKGAKTDDIYGASEALARGIAKELGALGLTWAVELDAAFNEGVARRPYSPEGLAKTTVYYPDGSVADYNALIRYSITEGLPAIIIEHAYLCNEEEYRTFLSTDESLLELAQADARGIADALGLCKETAAVSDSGSAVSRDGKEQ